MQLEAILRRVRELLTPRGYGARWAWASLVVFPLALVAINELVPLRGEHYWSAALFFALTWAGPNARRFSLIAAPCAAVGLSYDSIPFFLPLRGDIHVADLWRWEHLLFPGPGGLSISDWLSTHTHPALDLIAGLTYITYLFEVFFLVGWFYFRRDPDRAFQLSLTFLIVNFVGWSIWIAWPAAPPWYVDAHGLGPAILDAAPSPAGTARFDELIGRPLFSSFYSRSTNVFGAMPSLHAAYPVLGAILGWSFGRGTRVATVIYALLMAFSAVYLRHHYILDVLAGVALAFLGSAAVGLLLRRERVPQVTRQDALDLGPAPLEREPLEPAPLEPAPLALQASTEARTLS